MKIVSPEAVWQAKQNHYCLTDKKDFPLLPLDMSEVSKIAIWANSNHQESFTKILRDFPLTTDGKNQWFANTPYQGGLLSVRFRPELQADNCYLLYHTTSRTNFSAQQVRSGIEALNYLRRL